MVRTPRGGAGRGRSRELARTSRAPEPSRARLAAILAVVTPLGFLTKAYSGPAAAWVNDSAGGVLYVAFWLLVVLWLRPSAPVRTTAALVFALTCGLEFLQLWHPPFLEAIRASFLGRTLIGTSFAAWDFPHYAVGALLGVGLARCARPRHGLGGAGPGGDVSARGLMSHAAVFAFLILSLLAVLTFGGTFLLAIDEALLGRVGGLPLFGGLAAGLIAAGLAWLWFAAALALARTPEVEPGPSLRAGAWAAALVGAGAAAASLLERAIRPGGLALALICLLAALPHMGPPLRSGRP